MMASQNLSEHSISWFDRKFIQSRAELKKIEDLVNLDPRFPDFVRFKAHLAISPNFQVVDGPWTLSYLSTVADPLGGIRVRFSLNETVGGMPFPRPVTAEGAEDGRTVLRLNGIAY